MAAPIQYQAIPTTKIVTSSVSAPAYTVAAPRYVSAGTTTVQNAQVSTVMPSVRYVSASSGYSQGHVLSASVKSYPQVAGQRGVTLVAAQSQPRGVAVDNLKSPDAFVAFLTAAVKNKMSPEYKELYLHLQRCFTDADFDLDGMIGPAEFDAFIESAAAAPRKFGFAPTADQMYMSDEERKAARDDLFKTMDVENRGLISFQAFLSWATTHIDAKTHRGAKPWKSGVGMLSLIQPASAEDFVEFLRHATTDARSQEYKDLYFHLLRCFTDADTNMMGVIDADGFDGLIDIAANAPRKFGFAPSVENTYRDAADRKAARADMFRQLDSDGSGTISFDEFFAWAFTHITEKVSGDVQALYPAQAVKESTAIVSKNLPIFDSESSTADGFVRFCRTAVTNRRSAEYTKLYFHLLRCFVSGDTEHTGQISAEGFDKLIDVAAAAPRKFGFAPKASELFSSVEERLASRADLFRRIDSDGSGLISFQEFLNWALLHIEAKVMRGATPWKAGVGKLSLIQTSSADDFVQFLSVATTDQQSQQYEDLYFHLLRCFTDADTTMTGVIDADGFDKLIDIAARAPRKYGFAPSSGSMFRSAAERKDSRAALFQTIDRDGGGTISFDEFLGWAFAHIADKVAAPDGVRVQYAPENVREDMSLAAKNLPIYDDAASPEQFAQFCTKAVNNRRSPEYQKLYYHLLRCFSDADSHHCGLINADGFDALVERAAAAPRKFGFAPSASELFFSAEDRRVARAELFSQIDTTGTGLISFQAFIAWAVEHIKSKVSRGAAPWKSGVGKLSYIQTSSAQDFVQFLTAATSSNTSPQYKELYFHLLRCFTDADTTMSGVIDANGFDSLIDIAGRAPRKYGFAPSAASMFRDANERRASRTAMFQAIDTDGSGTISFDEFFHWALTHITEKVSQGVVAQYPPERVHEDLSLVTKNLPIYDEATSAEDFARFCMAAVKNNKSPEYKKLYYHLLRCFSDADTDHQGQISAAGFDALIDIAAAAPRRFGFAPTDAAMYATVDERRAARADLFRTIDADGSGLISFQEFLAWAVTHIAGKVSEGVKTFVYVR